MHERVRALDWAATPLGPASFWPPSLKFAVDHTLASGFPSVLFWGRDLIQIYNDAYLRFMDWREVPLGAGFQATWPEFYDRCAADLESVFRGETILAKRTYFSNAQFEGGHPIWLSASVGPVRDEAGSVVGISMIMIDSTQEALAEATLRENEAQLAQLLELLPVGVTLLDREGKIVKRNPEMKRLLKDGWGNPAGRRFDRDGRIMDPNEYASARALRGETVPPAHDLLLEFTDEKRWLRTGAVPFMRDGTIAGGIAVAYDVTEAKQSAGRMELLIAELQHRTRNLIAMVQSIASRTLHTSRSLDEFAEKFPARLAALGRVQGLLSRLTEGNYISFEELLRAELMAHTSLDDGETRVKLDGPGDVRLETSTVQIFGLALHELATNAVKYGALSQPNAHLAVCWHVAPADDPDRQNLCVDWRETGVLMPQADAEPGSGQGRELIEDALPYQLGARTTFELCADGVHCTLCVPLTSDVPARPAEGD
jgi:two-component system CheB/CheR fusion protein